MSMPSHIAEARRLVQTYESARKRNKQFNLSAEYIHNIMQQTVCAYSGEKFGDKEAERMSLERFNNNVGYVEGNVIPVKKKYNTMRGDFELDGLIAHRALKVAQIARAVVANKPKGAGVITPKFYRQVRGLVLHIKVQQKALPGREKRYSQLNSKPENERSAQEKTEHASLRIRLSGIRAEVGRTQSLLDSLLMTRAVKRSKNLSEAERAVEAYDIIIKGLARFENLSSMDKRKLAKGLPLNASVVQLIRGKM